MLLWDLFFVFFLSSPLLPHPLTCDPFLSTPLFQAEDLLWTYSDNRVRQDDTT